MCRLWHRQAICDSMVWVGPDGPLERKPQTMAVAGAPQLDPTEQTALEHDYRTHADRLVRQRSHILLLCTELETQADVARVVRCSTDTVRRTLAIYRRGGRVALPRQRSRATTAAQRVRARQELLAQAMKAGPAVAGLTRPTWTAPLLADYLQRQTGQTVNERSVRRDLEQLGYRLGRPTWTVRHKAEAEPDYGPKGQGSKRS
jgi:transposase